MRLPGICLLAVLAVLSAPAAAGAGPLQTALIDHDEISGPDADLALQRTRAAGATAYRVILEWYRVAPVEPPAGFNAADPADPAYDWAAFDRKIQRIVRHGLAPIVVLLWPPTWAGGGFTPTPDPVEAGKFARAVATRYSGSFGGLPPVRYWMAWNEPNVELDFSPQFDAENRPVSPAAYRTLLREVAAGIHAAHPNNLVIAGALSPFANDTRDYLRTMAPLPFMRDLLCMSAGRPPRPTCNERAVFDVWAHHPYTRGGPTHRASKSGDVSLGNLSEMTALLRAAVRAGHVSSRRPVRFWATEFSWDTKPPDPLAVPLRLQARWVSEAFHRMWKHGVDLVAWLQLRDAPYPQKGEQAGLWYYGGPRLACDDPKVPTLTSFRFPFVAYRQRGRVSVWGRTPAGRRARVVVERLTRRGWKPLGRLRTDRSGIFSGRVAARPARGRFREPLPRPRSFHHAVLCEGPRAYWRLGERSGAAARDEVAGAAGTYAAGVALGVRGAVTTDTDTAVTLNGEGKVALGWQPSPRTVELWLRTSHPGPAAAFSNRNEINHHVFVGTSGDGRLLAFDSHPLTSERRVDDDRWHHVVYTYDGAVGRLYLDGGLVASAAYERIEGGAEASLGHDASLATAFRGSLDEVALYDVALSERQIREHYAARAPRRARTTVVAGPYVRARLADGSAAAQPFSLARFRDRVYDPFGYPGTGG